MENNTPDFQEDSVYKSAQSAKKEEPAAPEGKTNFFRSGCLWLKKGLDAVGQAFLRNFPKIDIYVFLVIATALGFLCRAKFFGYASNDFNAFLKGWYTQFYDNGIQATLGSSIGDYTPAYMYFLAFISLFHFEPSDIRVLYWIKGISVFFDLGSAVFAYLIARKISNHNKLIEAGAYTLAFFAPTVLWNSAMWGQCDSIFACFCLMTLYFYLTGHERTAWIMYGVAFSFKLQAIFILPALVYMMLKGKARFRFIIWVPLVYLLIAVPSLACGRSFKEIMGVYFNQTGEYNYLSCNAPSIFMFIGDSFSSADSAVNYLLPAATTFGLIILGTCLFCLYAQKGADDSPERLVKIFYLFTLLAPFVLPKMHDRYFYLADAFAAVYFAANPKKFYIPVLALIGSMAGYIRYLFGLTWLSDAQVTLRIGAVLILVALILLTIDVFAPGKPASEPVKAEAKNKAEIK
jgi:Gpi18-like mannosyltransferase